MLGFVELVRRAERWKFKHRWPANSLKFLAAILILSGLDGIGRPWPNADEILEIAVPALNVLMFLAFLGKGSLDVGFQKVLQFFSHITGCVGDFIYRLTSNFLPFLVNLTVIAFIITIVKIATNLFLNFPVIPDFLRSISFVNIETALSTFRAFFHQLWVVPVVLKYSAITLNWMFFEESNE